MSAKTFVEWQAYSSIEPFGPVAEFWRTALIASILANNNRSKKSDKTFTPEDFMPKGMQSEPQEMPPELKADVLRQNFEVYQQAQKVTGQ
jgi:hypothetical protein